MLTGLKADLTASQEEHDELSNSLQEHYEASEEKRRADELAESLREQYDASEAKLDALKKELGDRMKVMRAALSGGDREAAAAGKDEV